MLLCAAQCASSSALAAARDLRPLTFTPTQPAATLQMAITPERCKTGAPLQWRPYLDATSKAYLAPVVALASLERFTLSPIQLAGPRSPKTPASDPRLHPLQASLVQHAQSVNNAGVLIEATFQVRKVLRRPLRGADLGPGRLVSLLYKVSASLATTSDMIALANSMEQANQSRVHREATRQPTGGECPLELTEKELSKRGGDLFKMGRDYVLFVEPTLSGLRRLTSARQQQQQQQVEQWWHAFASHEPVTNQTTRSVNRVLCKNCGK
jgi:hypothetical protein